MSAAGPGLNCPVCQGTLATDEDTCPQCRLDPVDRDLVLALEFVARRFEQFPEIQQGYVRERQEAIDAAREAERYESDAARAAVAQAEAQIARQSSRAWKVRPGVTLAASARSAATIALVGNWVGQGASSRTACMKASETATLMLACSIATGRLVSGSIFLA